MEPLFTAITMSASNQVYSPLSLLFAGVITLGLLDCSAADDDVDDLMTDDDVDPNADDDGDGLLNAEEAELGTDPLNPDTDEDGLDDLAEQMAGTNPNAADSDEDGYWDAWEIAEETDPLDSASVIYECGWPYNPNKDSLKHSGTGGAATPNKALARFVGTDQCGDQLDMFDFSGHDKPVVIDISALWCSWCHELALLIEGKPSQLDGELASYGIDKERLVSAVANHEIYWVTVISQDLQGRPAKVEHVGDWHELHPNNDVALLLDRANIALEYVGGPGLPAVIWTSSEMVCQGDGGGDYLQVLADVLASLPSQR
jgi:hypothetical protein